jgi:hypothetical protein
MCVSGPEVLKGRWAFRFLELGDPEPPEDVEATLYVFQFFKDGMEAILEGDGMISHK